MMSNNLPTIHALWIGEKLGAISRCCLHSFVM
ncbi:galactosyltransferase Lgt5, partial [Acinetobacter baumannii]